MDLVNVMIKWCLVVAYYSIPGGRACISGWVKERAGCYRLYNITRTWHLAADACQQSAGHQAALVTVNDLTEQTFVMQMRPDVSDQMYWIGYFKNGTIWQWLDLLETGIDQLDRTNATRNTGCAAITRQGSWLPVSCDDTLPFFCEYHERGVVPSLKKSTSLPVTRLQPTSTTPVMFTTIATTSANGSPFRRCFGLKSSIEMDTCLQFVFQADDVLCNPRPLDTSDVTMTSDEKLRLVQNYIRLINDQVSGNMMFPTCSDVQVDGILTIESIADTQWFRPEELPYSSWETNIEILFTQYYPNVNQSGPIFEGVRTGCIVHSITQTSEDVQLSIIVTATTPHRVIVEGSEPGYNVFVVSSVLTMSAFQRGNKTSLGHIFTMFYTHLEDESDRGHHQNVSSSSVYCAYYVVSTRVWSRWGCTVQGQDRYTVTCSCNHTTSFAVLMKVRSYDIPEVDKIALNVITYIGCSVSMVTVFMALTIFTCVRSLDSGRVYVHRHLCLAILSSQVAFLAGIQATANRTVCQVVAMFLHFCFTAVFTWMLVEGLHLYTQVIQVFGPDRSRSNYYLLFGWGIPLVAVVVAAAADIDGYGTRKCCWLSTERKVIWAFIGPVVAVITVNAIILVMVVRVVVTSATNVDVNSSTRLKVRAAVKGITSLLPLLGLTWIFGLLAINKDLIVFEYLFAFFNSLQGFFVFLFHCVRNTEAHAMCGTASCQISLHYVRQALSRLRERHALVGTGYHQEASPPSCRDLACTENEISLHVKMTRPKGEPFCRSLQVRAAVSRDQMDNTTETDVSRVLQVNVTAASMNIPKEELMQADDVDMKKYAQIEIM